MDSELEEHLYLSDGDDSVISEIQDNLSGSSTSEDETSDEEENISTSQRAQNDFVLSKNGLVNWKTSPPNQQGRTSSANIIKLTPGATRYAISRITDIKFSLLIFFERQILSKIIEMSNKEGQVVFGNEWKIISDEEFLAYIGILLLAGVYRSRNESTKSLWDSSTGRPIFKATMSLKRFHLISRVIRFDDKNTRIERREKDKLAPVREIWNKWVEILPILYNPTENVTVDEQLVPFRGRCPFRQYIPSKPAKYGIKIWALCDSSNAYAYNMQIYCGRQPGAPPEKNQGLRVVLDLTASLTKGYNITCDNFFTSHALSQMLLKRRLTMLGTVRKNKPELPISFTNNKKDVYSSKFYFTDNTTVVSYVPKRNKTVTLMSTMHRDAGLTTREDKKPNMIMDYNKTKGAVDTLDKLILTYSCRRQTKRWPMTVFYNMIDVSAYNGFVLWCQINPQWNAGKLTKRRIFLEELGRSLVEPYVQNRSRMPHCENAKRVVSQIQAEKSNTIEVNITKKRKRCDFCPSSNDNKTNTVCCKCLKYLCKAHVTTFCPQCKN